MLFHVLLGNCLWNLLALSEGKSLLHLFFQCTVCVSYTIALSDEQTEI